MKPNFKLWIDNDGKAFGLGPYMLLMEVEKTGSLLGASKNLNMSYNKAHGLIKSIEKKLGFKVLIKKTGGVNGGSSYLTLEAKDLLSRFGVFYKECSDFISSSFEKNFTP